MGAAAFHLRQFHIRVTYEEARGNVIFISYYDNTKMHMFISAFDEVLFHTATPTFLINNDNLPTVENQIPKKQIDIIWL